MGFVGEVEEEVHTSGSGGNSNCNFCLRGPGFLLPRPLPFIFLRTGSGDENLTEGVRRLLLALVSTTREGNWFTGVSP